MTYTPSGSLIPTALSFYELPRAHYRRDELPRGFPVVAREEHVTGGRLPTQAAGALVPRLLVFGRSTLDRAFRSGHATRPPPRTDSVQIHLRPHRNVLVHP